jgi:hypothetical protein
MLLTSTTAPSLNSCNSCKANRAIIIRLLRTVSLRQGGSGLATSKGRFDEVGRWGMIEAGLSKNAPDAPLVILIDLGIVGKPTCGWQYVQPGKTRTRFGLWLVNSPSTARIASQLATCASQGGPMTSPAA